MLSTWQSLVDTSASRENCGAARAHTTTPVDPGATPGVKVSCFQFPSSLDKLPSLNF